MKFTPDSKADFRIICEIAERALKATFLARAWENDPVTKQDLVMDLSATHCNGCPLQLEALRDADDFHFAHDILGIRRHLNRETGKLEDFFSPRLRQRKAA